MKTPTLVLAAALALSACSSFVNSPNQVFAPQFVVANVNPGMLAGTWRIMAGFPAAWDKDCSGATLVFSPYINDSILVTGTCSDRATGVLREVSGEARVEEGGRIRVRMQGGFFGGDFWVLDVAPDGRSVTMGNSMRTAGWVMSREAGFDKVAFDRAMAAFERSGYDAAALQRAR